MKGEQCHGRSDLAQGACGTVCCVQGHCSELCAEPPCAGGGGGHTEGLLRWTSICHPPRKWVLMPMTLHHPCFHKLFFSHPVEAKGETLVAGELH